MYYIIYKTTNIVNNKIYIGKHKTDNLNDGYLGSGTVLLRSIEKYGRDKFKKEVLYTFNSEEEMNLMEEKIVDKEFISRKDTYNLATGGQGGSLGGLNHGPNHPATKKDREFFKKIGQNGWDEVKRKILNIPGFKEERQQKAVEGLLKHYENNIGHFTSKNHSEETKEKMRQHKGKQKGNKNSQFGTCWVYNEELKQSKKINKNEQIPNGWKLGRKIN